MSPDWINVSVAIPADRVVEFHTEHAAWLTKVASHSNEAPAVTKAVPWTAGDAALARQYWAKLSDTARRLLSVFIVDPEKRFSGSELAARLNIPRGMHGVAGTLAWPKRHAAAMGRFLPVSFQYGPLGEGSDYWMTAGTAAAFRHLIADER